MEENVREERVVEVQMSGAEYECVRLPTPNIPPVQGMLYMYVNIFISPPLEILGGIKQSVTIEYKL